MNRAMLVALLAIATPLFAVEFRASISADGKPIPKGVKVDVTCGSKSYSAESDANGNVKLEAPETGKCVLKMTYEGQTPSVEVTLEGAVTHYEIVLERNDGKLTLKVGGKSVGIP